MHNIDKIFNSRINDYHYNTSYPITPKLWQKYKSDNQLSFFNVQEYSWYIHIPFCKSLCKFCEYTRFKTVDIETERHYLKTIWKDIADFVNNNNTKETILRGLDVGGGTPTSLTHTSLYDLIQQTNFYADLLTKGKDFCGSIEGSFNTIDKEKIIIIADNAKYINRMSFGLQSSAHLMKSLNRNNGNLKHMVQIFDWCRKYGIKILNIDLMYGLPNQTEQDIHAVIDIIKELMPEHLTLYEYRTNMLKETAPSNTETRYMQYAQLFNLISDLDYSGHFGGNTFSQIGDEGLSSYLKYRMIENGAYKGFGIASQSKNAAGLSYNIGKGTQNINDCLPKDTYEAGGQTYLLPPKEMLAKYLAISGYYGKFKLSKMDDIIGQSSIKVFAKEFKYLLYKGFITIDKDLVSITKKGFKYYGAILSLFYPNSEE